MDTYTINKELDQLYKELDELTTMSCKQACKKYNFDYKSEATTAIQGEIEILENELHQIIDEEDEYDTFDAHGFANETDYVRWRYGA